VTTSTASTIHCSEQATVSALEAELISAVSYTEAGHMTFRPSMYAAWASEVCKKLALSPSTSQNSSSAAAASFPAPGVSAKELSALFDVDDDVTMKYVARRLLQLLEGFLFCRSELQKASAKRKALDLPERGKQPTGPAAPAVLSKKRRLETEVCHLAETRSNVCDVTEKREANREGTRGRGQAHVDRAGCEKENSERRQSNKAFVDL